MNVMPVSDQREILEAFERGEKVEICFKTVHGLENSWELLKDRNHEFNFQKFAYRIKHGQWRAEDDGVYFYINDKGDVVKTFESHLDIDTRRFRFGNYFRTEMQADKAKLYIAEYLEKVHDGHDD